MKRAAAESLDTHSNQYPPMTGVPELRAAVARHAARHSGQQVSADGGGVLVTSGATEGIAAALLGLCNRGDRVVVFEPLYDAYAGIAATAGVELAPVRLRPPTWALPPPPLSDVAEDATDAELDAAAEAEAEAAMEWAMSGKEEDDADERWELARAFFPPAPKRPAKLVILNTPHNPTGKVFTRAELARIAALTKRANALALLDEVYEHLTYEADGHRSLATAVPGMAARCVRLGSAGKTFSFTGWKVGWATGPAKLLAPMVKCHQFLTFTTASAMQYGVAHGLEHCRDFYLGLGGELAAARASFAPRVAALGFRVLPAQATYFLVADATAFVAPGEDDAAFCRRLAAEGGVALIPVSAFYLPEGRVMPPRTLVRFAFCKSASVLDAAIERLEKYLGRPGARGPGARGDAAFGERAAREQAGGSAA
jgi:aspartate/methionine/tyrosine aminotransferase